MKKIMFAILMVFATINVVKAQENMGRKTAEQRSELITENLTKKLSLSNSQKDSIYDVILMREKYRDAGKLTEEKKKETDAQIKKILTKEQHEQWMELRKEAREKHQQNQHGEKKKEPIPDSE